MSLRARCASVADTPTRYPSVASEPGGAAYASTVRRARRPPRSAELGASLVGLLVTLVLLGGIAGVVVLALPSETTLPTLPTTSSDGGHGTTPTTHSLVSAAIVQACVADVESIQSAAQNYQALNGVLPPAGAAWATSAAHNGPFLQSWPAAREFAVRWTGHVVVVTPSRGAAATGTGTASPATGCFAA
jgi:hypothetical protein